MKFHRSSKPSRNEGRRPSKSTNRTRRRATINSFRPDLRPTIETLETRSLLSGIAISGVPNWVEQGPRPLIDNGNVVVNPTGPAPNPAAGAVEGIAINPNLNPDGTAQIFAATVGGGIWRTNNADVSNPTNPSTTIWTPLTDQLGSLATSSIAFAPTSIDPTDKTLFAGSTSLSSYGDADAQPILGVLRTTDGGTTWNSFAVSSNEPKIKTVLPTSINLAASGPSQEMVLVAGINPYGGLYRSDNNGQTFALLSGANGLPIGQVSQLIADPGNISRFYAALPGLGVFEGDFDPGTKVITWSTFNTGIPAASISSSQDIQLAASNAGGSTELYVGLANSNGTLSGIFQSSDTTANWISLGTPAGFVAGALDQHAFSMLGDPTDNQAVYIAGLGNVGNDGAIFRYDPVASSWVNITGAGANNSLPHPDVRNLAFLGNNVLVDACDGGLYFLPNAQNASSSQWGSLDGEGTAGQGLGSNEVHNVAWDSNSNVILGGAQDNGSNYSNPINLNSQQSSGGVWNQISFFNPFTNQTGFVEGDGGDVAVDNFTLASSGQSIRYAASQGNSTPPLNDLTRQVFDASGNPVGPGELIAPIGLAGFNGLFITPTVLDAIPPTPAQIAAGQSTRMVIGGYQSANPIYESNNVGSAAPNAIMWTAVPIAPGFSGTVNALAYGGRYQGVANADVLYAGDDQHHVYVRTTAGGMLSPTASPFPGGDVRGISLDPTNWMHAFVIGPSGVWETTDAGNSWTPRTGNLSNSNLRSVEYVHLSTGDVVLVGGQGGVYRMFTNNPGVWTKLGANLPNSIAYDVEYNATSDVLVVGTFGRGTWTISNASSVLAAPPVLAVTGDQDYAGENDTFRLVLDPNNPLLLDVFVNNNSNVPDEQIPLASLQTINVNGLGGNDTLIIDDSNGLINVNGGIHYDGGTGFNTLQIVQSGGAAQTKDVYSVGPNNGEGSDVITGPTGAQTIDFQNLAPVLDTVPAATAIVDGTPADNAINYTTGSVAANGLITIDNQESYEFSNKTALTINSGAGSDTINLNNQANAAPAGLTAITVNGNDPTASDTLIVNGIAGVNDDLQVTPTGTGSGTVGDTPAPTFVPVTFSGIEHLTMVGQTGDADGLRVARSGFTNSYAYTPGATGDAGTLTGTASNGAFDITPLSFTGFSGFFQPLSDSTGGDTLTVNGTGGDDKISYDLRNFPPTASPLQAVVVNGGTPIFYGGFAGFGDLVLNGLSGNDTFNVTADAASSTVTVTVNGGGDSGDSLGYIGVNGAPTTLDFSFGSINSPGISSVLFTGIASLGLGANGGVLTVADGVPNARLTITPSSAGSGTVQAAGFSTLATFGNAAPSGVVVQMSSGGGTLTVDGTVGNDSIAVTRDATMTVGVNGFLPIKATAADLSALVVNTGLGVDSVTVTDSTGVFPAISVVGGQAPASVTLNVTTTAGTTEVFPGPTPDGGSVSTPGGTINYSGVTAVTVTGTGADTLHVFGSTGSDIITDDETSVAVNNDAPIGYMGFANVAIFGQSGSDTLVLDGSAGTDSPIYSPKVSDSTVAGLGATITFNGINNLVYNGQGGNDTFNVVSPAGADTVTYTPGGAADAGSVSVGALTPVSFSNLGTTGSVSLSDPGGRTDSLVYNGTAANDNITVDAGTGTIYLLNHIDVATPGVANLTLNDVTGENTYTISATAGNSQPYTKINVNGSGLSDPDVLTLNGDGTPVVVTLGGTSTLVSGGGLGTVASPLTITGVGTVNLTNGAGAVTVDGTTGPDTFNVTPTGASSAAIQANGLAPVLNATTTGTLLIDALAGNNTVTVNGTSGSDTITTTLGATTTVSIPGQLPIELTAADTQSLVLSGGAGADTYKFTGAGGPANLTVVGGATFSNTIDLPTVAAGGTYAVFPGSGSASGFAQTFGSSPIAFSGVQTINITGGGGANADIVAIDGTSGGDVFSATPGGVGATTGTAQVNGGPLVTFTNLGSAASLLMGIINTPGGSDSFSLSQPATGAIPTVSIRGGTSSSATITDDTPGHTMNYSPLTASTGTVVDSAGTTYNFIAGMASISVVGAGNNALSVTTPVADTTTLTPGSAADSGTVQSDNLTPLAYSNLGAASSLTINDAGGTLVYNGTPGNDSFTVNEATDIIGLNSQIPVSVTAATPPATLTLNGLAGDNTYAITAAAAPLFATINVNGSGTADPDVLNLNGNGTAIVANVGTATPSVTGGGLGTVDVSGVGTVNINAGTGKLTVNGTTGADTLAVTPTSATAASFQAYSGGTAQNGQGGTLASLTSVGPAFNATNVSAAAGGFAINGNGGSDTLYVEGTQNADTIDVNDAASSANAVLVAGLLAVNYNAALPHVEIDGLAGSDTINIAPSTTTSFLVDGGDPIGVQPGDTINLIHPAGPYQIFAGPTSDSGGLNTPGFQTVSWAHIETLLNTGGGSPIITRTNGNDEITVIARDASYNAAADGVQDFTVSVNSGPDMLFINTPNLFIDSLSGNDDIVVREPAPNQAVWNVQVYVAGGAPASGANQLGDNVELETPGTQSVTYNANNPTPVAAGGATFTSPNAGGGQFSDTTNNSTVTATQFDFLNLYRSSAGGAENFIYAGEAGNDTLTYNTPANANAGNNLVYTPGATPDAGTINGSQSGGAALTPLTFSGLGTSGTVSFTTSNAGRTDHLNVEGVPTSAGESFSVTPANSGTVQLSQLPPASGIITVPITTASVNSLELDGLGGNDPVNLTGGLPYTNTIVDDGAIVNLSGATGAVAVNLANSAAATNTTITGYGGTVTLIGVDAANLNAGTNAVSVNGSTADDNLAVTPTGPNSATAQDDGAGTVFNVGNAASFTTDLMGGNNTLTINGSSANDAITAQTNLAANPTVTVTSGANPSDLPIAYVAADLAALDINSLAGNDVLTVDATNGAVTPAINYDGGIGTNALQLKSGGAAGNVATGDVYTPGSQLGSGTDALNFTVGGAETVHFVNLAPIFDFVAGPLTVNGTNAANSIDYKEGYNSLANFLANTPSATWGQVSVDSYEPIEFINKTTLTLNDLAGSDTVNLNNPNTPTGLTSITVTGGGATVGGDTLVVNGTTAPNAIVYTPDAADPTAGNVTGAGPVPVNFSAITQLNINGQGGGDSLKLVSPAGADTTTLTPGATFDSGSLTDSNATLGTLVPVAFSHFGAGGTLSLADTSGNAVDSFAYNGTAGDDVFTVVPAGGGTITLNSQLPVVTPGVTNLTLNGLGGDDVFSLSGTLPYAATTLAGVTSSNDVATFTGAAGPVAVNLGDSAATPPTNTKITGYGGTVSLIGIAAANLDAGGNALTAVGTAHNDNLTYTPTGAAAGTFSNAGLSTTFNFTSVGGAFTMTGGTGGTDRLTVNGSPTRDLFEIDQGGRTVQVLAHNTVAWKTVTLDTSISTLNAVGQSGQDTFQVIPAAGVGTFPLDNLLINIDGDSGAIGANNALVIANSFGTSPASLPATSFVVDNRGRDLNSGTIRVFQSAVANPDINYTNVQVVSPLVATSGTPNGNLLIMGPDTNEPNETKITATSLGTSGNVEVSHASIFPNNTEFPGVPADQDYYSVTAQQTGTLDFVATFNLYSPTLLPGGGNLNLQVLDAAGNVIASASGGAATFGADGTAANARIRIPAVAGQTYFLHVFGADSTGNASGAVVNGYNLSIVDTPAIVPFNLELSRSVPAGVAGTPDTGDLPTSAPGDDSGRSQFDNVTNNNKPRIYLRLSDGIYLNDLPGNGTTDNPPVGVIPIPFSPNATTPGFRVAIFDGNNTQTPVGFASQVAGFPGLYEFDFPTALADGIHNLTAEVQIVDPQKANETGFGATSATLALTIDTVPPPVSFGSTGVANSGLDGTSDSGIPGQPPTIVDRITNVSTPTLYGVAEANSIVRLYDDVNGNGIVDAGDVFLGQATAIPVDGTNAMPNGQWRITSNVDLNNPKLGFPLDGLRNLLVTGEDLAGNVSAPAALSIFVDTQGPTVNKINITGSPSYPLFATKLTNPSTPSPTPLVSSLDITFNDQPVRVGPNFVYPAVNPTLAETTSNYELVGENTGVIPITSVTFVDSTASGTPGMSMVTLHFPPQFTPLPDDRYTLTVSDAITDNAGNPLQGNFNGAGFPSGLVSGNGSQGSSFVGAFTVNSRAHVGVYSSGTVALDINGNGIFDPRNSDAVNRDAVYAMGYATDRLFAGNFTTAYGNPTAPGTASGFDKLAAYGQDSHGNWRWMYDLSGLDKGAPTIIGEPFAIDGLPVAGNFDGNAADGDQVGLFDGTAWYLDVLNQGYISAADVVATATAAHPAGKINSDMAGLPFVGNFDGLLDLATYQNGVVEFDLASLDAGHVLTGQWNVKIDLNQLFPNAIPFNSVTARPVAGALSGLGMQESFGLYVPGGTTANPGTAEWYLIRPNTSAPVVTSAITTSASVAGGVLALNGNPFLNLIHQFQDVPLGGQDLMYQFGDQFALPVLGIWDPPSDGGSASGGSLPGASGTTSTTTDANWISHLYMQLLNREPTTADVTNWINQLNQGMTPAQVAESFVTGNEYRAGQINQLYEQYLGRPADSAGIQWWTAIWNATGGPEQVQAGIIGSAEFYATAGKQYPNLSADAAWVTALYHDLLGRDVDADGLSFWMNYIQTNSRASVVLGFVASDEYRLNLVNGWFQTYLGRSVDQTSGQAFVQAMDAGLSEDELLVEIASSQEYVNKS